MPFDENLVLINGTVHILHATDATHVPAVSTTRLDASGAAVIDIKETGIMGLAAVLVLPVAASGTTDFITCTIQASDEEAFGNVTYKLQEVVKFDILAATLGVILSSECPATVIRRFTTTKRYVRAVIAPTVGNGDADFGHVQVLLSPYPFKVL